MLRRVIFIFKIHANESLISFLANQYIQKGKAYWIFIKDSQKCNLNWVKREVIKLSLDTYRHSNFLLWLLALHYHWLKSKLKKYLIFNYQETEVFVLQTLLPWWEGTQCMTHQFWWKACTCKKVTLLIKNLRCQATLES